jgi:hypothetical protein
MHAGSTFCIGDFDIAKKFRSDLSRVFHPSPKRSLAFLTDVRSPQIQV